MFAYAGRAVARRLPVATTQLLPQTLVLRPALATRAFTVSHEALQPKTKASSDKEGTTTKKSAAKKTTEGTAKKSPKTKKSTTASKATKKPKKPAAKPKPKKKELTPEQKEKVKEKAKLEKDRAKVRELKVAALLQDEPRAVKKSPWTQHCEEVMKGERTSSDFKTLIKEAQESYKNLTSSEFEELKARSLEAKATNDAAHEQWVASHSLEEIYNANRARRQLNLLRGSKLHLLSDPRFPKGVRTPYILYGLSRRNEIVAQDSTLRAADVTKRLSEEWKQLSEADRKPFQDAMEKESVERRKVVDEIRLRAKELEVAARETAKAEEEAAKAARVEARKSAKLAKAAEKGL